MYLPSICLANIVKRAEHRTKGKLKQVKLHMLFFFFFYITNKQNERWKRLKSVTWWIKPTCAQVWYLWDLFLLLDQLIERAEDAQQLLHLVCHGHPFQDLHIKYSDEWKISDGQVWLH